MGIIGSAFLGYTRVFGAGENRKPAPILDEYGGAEAAFSLRLLDSTYTGSAITAYKSGGTTQDIGFVSGALDEDALLTFAAGGNVFVSKWYDQSGNGNNFESNYGGFDPTESMPNIVLNGVVRKFSGQPVFSFDGSPFVQHFEIDTPISYQSTSNQDFTILSVVQYGNLSGTQRSMIAGKTGNNVGDALYSGRTGMSANGSVFQTRFNDLSAGTDDGVHTIGATSPSSTDLFIVNSITTTPRIKAWYQGTQTLDYDRTGDGSAYDYAYTSIEVLNASSPAGTDGEGVFAEVIIYKSDESSNIEGINKNMNAWYELY
jgi:hypothetical protein